MAKKPYEKKKLPQTPAKTRDTRPPKLPRKVPPIVQEYNEMIIRVKLYGRELKKAENSNSIRFPNERMTLGPTKEAFHLLGLEREVIKIYEGLKEKLSLPYPVELLQLDSLYYKDGNGDIYHRLYLLTKGLRELSAGEEWKIKERELLNASLQPGQGEGKNTETPTYKWEYKEKEQTVSCNGKRPVRLEPRFFSILQNLHDNKGKSVSWRDLKKATRLSSRGAVRDAICDLKNIFFREFEIHRDELDKIIEAKKDKNRKITHYIFHA